MTTDDIAALFDSTRVLTGPATERYRVDGLVPAAAVQPESIEEVAGIVRRAGGRSLSLIAWGAGAHIDLGNRPKRFDVALDLSRLDAIVDYSPEDLVVSVEAGIRIAALNEEMAKHGQFLALDPPLAGMATAGGTLSAGLAGPIRQHYGTARDLVIGLTCVLADGQIVHSGGKVVKNVAGYDLNKLYLGAIGTLGIIVEASFKLQPLPAVRASTAAFFASCAGAHRAALAIVNSYLSPTAVEMAGPGAVPDVLEGGGSGWLLAVLVTGLPAAVERQRREIGAMITAAGATAVAEPGPEQSAPLFQRLRDFGRDRDRPAALILRCAVRPSEIAGAVAALEPVCASTPPAVLASPGSGTVRLVWYTAPASAEPLVRAVRSTVEGLSGTVSIERCPPALKEQVEVWGVAGPDLALMRDLKAAFDPAGTLSPGRFVDRL